MATYKRQLDSNDVDIVNAVETTSIEDTIKGKQPSGGIEIDNERVFSTDQLDGELFMRDEIEVFLNEPQNENDAAYAEVNVNGDYRLLVRGETVKIRRYHVEALARSKQSRVRQKKVVNNDGSVGYVEDNVLSLTYPFQVMHDPRPQLGIPWLKKLLANPA